MAQQPPIRPVVHKPPGYRDPYQPGRPVPGQPPRKPNVPPSFRPKRSRGSRCCRICCCVFCTFLLIVIIVVALAGGIFYLYFDPRLPAFYLLSFQIPKFDPVSKTDGTHLDVQAVTSVEVRNPNPKLDIFYGEGIEMHAILGDENDVGMGLGSKQLRRFTQRHRNTTNFKMDMRVRNKVVDQTVGRRLAAQLKSKEIKVAVEGKTRVGYVIKGWRIGTVKINVLCGGVKLKVVDAGEMPKCTINAFKWINIR
ncbi:unnamed protein product [Malus baccata var. baccata]|uniref:NDR1/HIN1-like protein 6 n=1 Tax=Malus domestica TaxID=3750 RepID=UPI003976A15B